MLARPISVPRSRPVFSDSPPFDPRLTVTAQCKFPTSNSLEMNIGDLATTEYLLRRQKLNLASHECQHFTLIVNALAVIAAHMERSRDRNTIWIREGVSMFASFPSKHANSFSTLYQQIASYFDGTIYPHLLPFSPFAGTFRLRAPQYPPGPGSVWISLVWTQPVPMHK